MQQNDSKTEEVKEQQKPEEEMEVTDQKVQENGDNKVNQCFFNYSYIINVLLG